MSILESLRLDLGGLTNGTNENRSRQRDDVCYHGYREQQRHSRCYTDIRWRAAVDVLVRGRLARRWPSATNNAHATLEYGPVPLSRGRCYDSSPALYAA